jgi:pimeloyl-ACP methyl ester carboxylesterase
VRDFEAGGLDINFFESRELEQEQRENPAENSRSIARNMLRFLMMKYEGNPSEMLSYKFLKAVFIKRNPTLLCGMRQAFQEGFDHVWEQLSSQAHDLSAKKVHQAHLFVSNCLCILPFADLKPGNIFYIPQLINGAWQRVGYRVEPIELTPTRGFETLFIHDHDRVFAYGLEPVGCAHAKPHLIFMGTTYPAGQGFEPGVTTDLERLTVGNRLYRTGHEKITAWLNKQANKTHVCGTSLGGSLALLLAIHQGERLSRVDALNPAGLDNSWRKSEFDRWDDVDEQDKPDVVIQKQGHDFVSSLGVWKNDWMILHVIPSKPASISVFDHARNYAGHADSEFNLCDAEQDNESRRVRNFLLYNLVRGAVYYLLVLPYHYLIRPALRYAFDHCFALAALGLVFACILPLMPLNLALIVIFVPIVLHVISTLVSSSDVWMGFSDLPPAKIHEPDTEEENNLELG